MKKILRKSYQKSRNCETIGLLNWGFVRLKGLRKISIRPWKYCVAIGSLKWVFWWRSLLDALRDMSLQQPAPPGHNAPCVPRRNMSQLLQEEQPNLPELRPNLRVCERKDTTYLSICLDPQVPGHKPLVCNKCIRFWESKLSYGAIPYTERSTSQRYLCERPFAYKGTHGKKIETSEAIWHLFFRGRGKCTQQNIN